MEDKFIRDTLSLFAKYDVRSELMWHTDLEHFYINCNDIFAYSFADCEEIFPEDLDQLERDLQIDDLAGLYLFITRKRKRLPIQAAYDDGYIPITHKHLFEEAVNG